MVSLFLGSYRYGLISPALTVCHHNLSFLPQFLSSHPKRTPKQEGERALEQPSDVTTGNVAKSHLICLFCMIMRDTNWFKKRLQSGSRTGLVRRMVHSRRPLALASPSREFTLTRATLSRSQADLVLFLVTKRVREPSYLKNVSFDCPSGSRGHPQPFRQTRGQLLPSI